MLVGPFVNAFSILNKFTHTQALIRTVEFSKDSMGKKEEIIYITYFTVN